MGKPRNIGRTEGKVFDFGECAPTSEECSHSNHSEDYTPYKYRNGLGITKTVDLFAVGVILLEMLCGKISVPHLAVKDKKAYGWKLVESNDVWKASWAVGVLRDGKAVAVGKEPCEMLISIPTCLLAKRLVRALIVDFETIQWDDINQLHDEFQQCTCKDYCCPGKRRLIERFIRASEYCISS